ncbi:MAG: DNA recombination protein RmuC, partial [Pseudomonadota bacterium]
MDWETALFSLVAPVLALIGAVLGWFFGARSSSDLRRQLEQIEDRLRSTAEALNAERVEAATLREKANRTDALVSKLEEVQVKRAALSERLAQLEVTAEEREKAFSEQKRSLVDAREAMLAEFKATGAEVLKSNQDEFLKRAEARFKESEATGEAKIKALLSPVGKRLEKYEKQVESLEKQRIDAFGQLNGLIQSMREGQEEVRREAQRLGNSLTNAPKARGRWGEQQLKNVLEHVGLAEHTDFDLEASIDTESGRLRPDAIVRIPGGKILVIDSKVSLNAYQAAFEADDDVERKQYMDLHA